MAKACGLSAATISRIWRAFGLKPHRCETFKLSRDPLFIEKVRDIVGLYLHPPERAVVLCVDEKPQIQALERSQPVLPMRPRLPERRTHDYRRHGTTSLFAALDVATGEVLGRCFPRHRAVEFRRFLDDIAKAVPEDLDIHLVLDNYGTHKTAMIHDWLSARDSRLEESARVTSRVRLPSATRFRRPPRRHERAARPERARRRSMQNPQFRLAKYIIALCLVPSLGHAVIGNEAVDMVQCPAGPPLESKVRHDARPVDSYLSYRDCRRYTASALAYFPSVAGRELAATCSPMPISTTRPRIMNPADSLVVAGKVAGLRPVCFPFGPRLSHRHSSPGLATAPDR